MSHYQMRALNKSICCIVCFVTLVAFLETLSASSVRSLPACISSTGTETASICRIARLVIPSAASAAASTPIAGNPADSQDDSKTEINWAWLALPAILGMLVITLRKRGGREQ